LEDNLLHNIDDKSAAVHTGADIGRWTEKAALKVRHEETLKGKDVSDFKIEYEQGLSFDDVRNSLPLLTVDNKVENDGFITEIKVFNMNNDLISKIFYDEKSQHYVFDPQYNHEVGYLFGDYLREEYLKREREKNDNTQEWTELNTELGQTMSKLDLAYDDEIIDSLHNEIAELRKDIATNERMYDEIGKDNPLDNDFFHMLKGKLKSPTENKYKIDLTKVYHEKDFFFHIKDNDFVKVTAVNADDAHDTFKDRGYEEFKNIFTKDDVYEKFSNVNIKKDEANSDEENTRLRRDNK
jgi:hypothetical protein